MPFDFIDLFAGIGGTRLAFDKSGGRCVLSSEIDKFACRTYKENFGITPAGDILDLNERDIPDHDILVAGFPCQPFSLAGVSKRKSLKMPQGFDCESKGQLFFKIVEILKAKKPKAFLLENVKHLVFHNQGETFRVIRKQLEDAGYDVYYQIIDASKLVPQHRERVYIVGFRKNLDIRFVFPEIENRNPKIKEILEKKVNPKYTISDKLWQWLIEYREKHKLKGNGFGYSLVDEEGIARTLSARYHKDGSEILVPQKNKNPRRLTPSECAALMGFPSNFKIPVSDTQAYRQFGNSVVVPIVERVVNEMVRCMDQSA